MNSMSNELLQRRTAANSEQDGPITVSAGSKWRVIRRDLDGRTDLLVDDDNVITIPNRFWATYADERAEGTVDNNLEKQE